MGWKTMGAAIALAVLAGGCADDRAEAPAGGGGPAYQAERRPDAFEARRHMATALVDASRTNAAIVRGDWAEAPVLLEALRSDLRLAARRGTMDQQTRVLALENKAIALASAIDRRSPEALAAAGDLLRDLVTYHDVYAWGPAGGGGGVAPRTQVAPPPRVDAPATGGAAGTTPGGASAPRGTSPAGGGGGGADTTSGAPGSAAAAGGGDAPASTDGAAGAPSDPGDATTEVPARPMTRASAPMPAEPMIP